MHTFSEYSSRNFDIRLHLCNHHLAQMLTTPGTPKGSRYSDHQPHLLVLPILFSLIYDFIYFWLCWVSVAVHRLSSSCGEWGLLFIEVRELLVSGAPLVGEHGLSGPQAQWFWPMG